MMEVGKRISNLRERKGWTGVQLAERAGLDQSYISKLERGRAGWSLEGLEAIAAALHVGVNTLLDGAFDAEVNRPARPQGKVPIYDFIQAGSPREVSRTFRDDDIDRYIPTDLSEMDELFGLLIRGRSMEPNFMEGDMVVFRRGVAPNPGDFVAATCPDVGSTFKVYKEIGPPREGTQLFALVPLNDVFPSYRSDESAWTIDGVLVRQIRDYRK